MKLFWKLYSGLFIAIVLSNAYVLLNRDSLIGAYYNTMIIFSNWYITPYFLNIFNALLSCLIAIFIFGYAFDVKGLNRAPAWLFYLRVLSDLTGHSFEMKTMQSGFVQSTYYGFIGVASLVLPIIPSYLAHWRMTFQKQ